jgi:hypothetical protein
MIKSIVLSVFLLLNVSNVSAGCSKAQGKGGAQPICCRVASLLDTPLIPEFVCVRTVQDCIGKTSTTWDGQHVDAKYCSDSVMPTIYIPPIKI